MAADRRRLPAVGAAASPRFPSIERETLPNRVRLWTVDHREADLVSLVLLLPAGSAADPPGCDGLAAFTADLLDDGTRRRSGVDLHDELGRIGGRLGTDVTSDATVLSITALARHARDALALLIELATEPRFDPDEVERVRALRISRLAQMRHVAGAVAERAFLRSVYGAHRYRPRAGRYGDRARADVHRRHPGVSRRPLRAGALDPHRRRRGRGHARFGAGRVPFRGPGRRVPGARRRVVRRGRRGRRPAPGPPAHLRAAPPARCSPRSASDTWASCGAPRTTRPSWS